MIFTIDSATEDVFDFLRKRTVTRDLATESVVADIVEDVRRRGDAALLESAKRFDAPDIQSILVTPEEIETAQIEDNDAEALRTARQRVETFHRSQLDTITYGMQKSAQGWFWPRDPEQDAKTFLGQRTTTVASAGVYVPGGNATYPSSVIMNAVPAKVAGVKDIAVTTPARKDGSLHPAVLSALREVGIDRAYKIGGAAAIAALALGTESIKKVDKIVGPGNRYVNEAKRQLWGQVGVDGYAGPSEVCVLADDQANAEFAAADLITQVEHAPDNTAFLITLSRAKMEEILDAVQRQLENAPRAQVILQALATESLGVIARDLDHAAEIIDAIAPEHLTLAVQNPEVALAKIHNAGCVLLGEYTPESAGDFCLGPSHTLPTSGAARFGSPVNVLDFLKVQSVVRTTKEDLQPLVATIEAFGEMEGFPAHAFGASVRFRSENQGK